ncbi:MAG: NADH-quinone oxidoreductase subunit K [Candidatus Omnitrophica bacterium]|nr:NADH-quinone oxidoreductase subunit K [Candidatus Omnitrophota bacterium]MDD5352099.1 NADH-quinone oxidoreductase subunit K [Candidatus Omnitrophota bacterium]MDD5549697.1 NADH-quinone oxidoreductase subunit K [Candidatus Omnitrophota bacterium]
MNTEVMRLFWSYGLFISILCIIGFYCILVTYNLIRALVGLEILIKAATLLIIVAGYITGHEALAQSLVITLIVIEAVVITVAVGIVLGIRSHNNSLDARKIRNLKG